MVKYPTTPQMRRLTTSWNMRWCIYVCLWFCMFVWSIGLWNPLRSVLSPISFLGCIACIAKMWPIATNVTRSVVSMSVCQIVCLCVGCHTELLCNNGWTDRDAVWGAVGLTHVRPRNCVLHGVKIGRIHLQPLGVTSWRCGLLPICFGHSDTVFGDISSPLYLDFCLRYFDFRFILFICYVIVKKWTQYTVYVCVVADRSHGSDWTTLGEHLISEQHFSYVFVKVLKHTFISSAVCLTLFTICSKILFCLRSTYVLFSLHFGRFWRFESP